MTRARLLEAGQGACEDCAYLVAERGFSCMKYVRIPRVWEEERVRYVELHVWEGEELLDIVVSSPIESRRWVAACSDGGRLTGVGCSSINESVAELVAAREEMRFLNSMRKTRGQQEQQVFMLWWLPVEDHFLFQREEEASPRIALFSPLQHSVHGKSSLELAYRVSDPPQRFLIQVLLEDEQIFSSQHAELAETISGLPAGEHLLRVRLILLDSEDNTTRVEVNLDDGLQEEILVNIKVIPGCSYLLPSAPSSYLPALAHLQARSGQKRSPSITPRWS
eukprot:746166-Hanusia_phi.AAC.5